MSVYVCVQVRTYVLLHGCESFCLVMGQSTSINRRLFQYPSHKVRPLGGVCDEDFAWNIASLLKASQQIIEEYQLSIWRVPYILINVELKHG